MEIWRFPFSISSKEKPERRRRRAGALVVDMRGNEVSFYLTAPPPCSLKYTLHCFPPFCNASYAFVSIPLSALSRLVDMCTSMSGNKGMEYHFEVGIRFCNVLLSSFDFAAVCSITIMMRWPLFWRESREQWNICREFPPYLGIYFHALWRDAEGSSLKEPQLLQKRGQDVFR